MMAVLHKSVSREGCRERERERQMGAKRERERERKSRAKPSGAEQS